MEATLVAGGVWRSVRAIRMAAEEGQMPAFDSVLSDAQKLSADDQLRLIDALWDAVPPDVDLPLHEDWAAELERRVAAIQSGTAQTVSWETVRAEALARIKHGQQS